MALKALRNEQNVPLLAKSQLTSFAGKMQKVEFVQPTPRTCSHNLNSFSPVVAGTSTLYFALALPTLRTAPNSKINVNAVISDVI